MCAWLHRFAACLLLWGCASSAIHEGNLNMAASNPSPPLQAGQLPVNGISMYYEIHGNAAGTPLVLLHGGGSSIEVTYGRILPFLARYRRVIAIDEQKAMVAPPIATRRYALPARRMTSQRCCSGSRSNAPT